MNRFAAFHVDLDEDGVIRSTVTLAEWCEVEKVGRQTAYQLLRAGLLPAHKKNPTKRRSPLLVTPAEHREYRRRISQL